MLFAIKGGEKTFTVVVSNMESPPKVVEAAEDIWAVLKEGQFWFQLAIFDRSTYSYSFRVSGYERREGVMLEVDEVPSYAHYYKYSWQLLQVSQAIDAFITFESEAPYNPDYPMYQLVPDDLEVSRSFREHCPPGAVRRMLPYMWTFERYDPRDYMRQRPLISEYTNELLVHPYF